MSDRYMSLWFLVPAALTAAIILTGLLIGTWREQDWQFKFSLSTLLIITTFIALAIAFIAALVRSL